MSRAMKHPFADQMGPRTVLNVVAVRNESGSNAPEGLAKQWWITIG